MTTLKTLPQDIKMQWKESINGWLNIARRFQSIARKQRGYAIVKIIAVINQDGIPIMYVEPKMTLLEPRSAVSAESLQSMSDWCDSNSIDLSTLLELLTRS